MNHTLKRVLFDIITAATSWICFFYYRKKYIEDVTFEISQTFYIGILGVTLFWLSLYFLWGNYIDVRRVSRLDELYKTLYQSIIGCLIIFFCLIIDDIKYFQDYRLYYLSIIALTTTHFTLTFIARYFLTRNMVNAIRIGNIEFNTIIIGDTKGIEKHANQLMLNNNGNKFIGYINYNNSNININTNLPPLGGIEQLEEILQKYNIEEAILAIENDDMHKIEKIVYLLTYHDIVTKTTPNLFDLLSGKVKMNSLLDIPLIEINQINMTFFQKIIKRMIDITASLIALIILTPFLLITSLIIKINSKGPILYYQERIGLKNKIFNIIKFRSMHVNAEKSTPLLSSNNDTRITRWGKIMRKYRIDEIPQFINVLKGEMSIVGPRPERDFFAKKILIKAPYYKLTQKVKPGITSWGMVKFGYAENVEEMIERLKYDIIYIENLSLLNDFKVLIFTIMIVLQGRGK
jgi:exopolysaccharide biosynthesis polyprenyl glycosylphosphotransferase